MTIQEKAAEFREYLTTSKRGEAEIWTVRDNAPEWVRDVLYACHGGGTYLPDDWRYGFSAEAADALANCDDPDECDDQIEADVYTHDLLTWLASRNDRTTYVDDARADFGSGESVVDDIQRGQWLEKREVLSQLKDALQELVDAEEVES